MKLQNRKKLSAISSKELEELYSGIAFDLAPDRGAIWKIPNDYSIPDYNNDGIYYNFSAVTFLAKIIFIK